MKKNLIAALIVASLAPVSTISFAGSDTTSVINRMNVVANCEFIDSSKIQTLRFNLNPSVVQNRSNPVDLSYKCSSSTQFTLTLNDGLTSLAMSLASDPTKQIPFNLVFVNGTAGTTANGLVLRGNGQGFSTVASSAVFNLSIPHASFKDAPAGFYQKTINVTLTE